jgi:hypothetical protein
MAPGPDEQRPYRWRENWLTLAVVAFLVTSAMGMGVVGAVEVGPSQLHSGQGDGAALGQGSGANTADLAEPTSGLVGNQSLAAADTKTTGAGANDTFGAALTHGDVNGDGVEDVIVGAPRNNTANGNGSGAVYVFYGPVEERQLDAESANVTLYGAEGGDGAGYSLATGDVDDDGVDDIVVGAPFEETGADDAGAVYVVYGDDDTDGDTDDADADDGGCGCPGRAVAKLLLAVGGLVALAVLASKLLGSDEDLDELEELEDLE